MKPLKHVAKFSCGLLVSYFDLFRVRGTTDAATAATEEAFIATQYVGPVSLGFLASHWVWLLEYQTYLQLIPYSIPKPMRQLVPLSHTSTIWLGTNVCYPTKETAWNIMKLLSYHFWQVFLIILIDPSRSSPRLITNQAPLFSSSSAGSRIRLLPAQPWVKSNQAWNLEIWI